MKSLYVLVLIYEPCVIVRTLINLTLLSNNRAGSKQLLDIKSCIFVFLNFRFRKMTSSNLKHPALHSRRFFTHSCEPGCNSSVVNALAFFAKGPEFKPQAWHHPLFIQHRTGTWYTYRLESEEGGKKVTTYMSRQPEYMSASTPSLPAAGARGRPGLQARGAAPACRRDSRHLWAHWPPHLLPASARPLRVLLLATAAVTGTGRRPHSDPSRDWRGDPRRVLVPHQPARSNWAAGEWEGEVCVTGRRGEGIPF